MEKRKLIIARDASRRFTTEEIKQFMDEVKRASDNMSQDEKDAWELYHSFDRKNETKEEFKQRAEEVNKKAGKTLIWFTDEA
ncbi:hypothetical protein D3C81_333740 [compost metagenome]